LAITNGFKSEFRIKNLVNTRTGDETSLYLNESNARGPFLLPLTSSFTENLMESLTRHLQWGK